MIIRILDDESDGNKSSIHSFVFNFSDDFERGICMMARRHFPQCILFSWYTLRTSHTSKYDDANTALLPSSIILSSRDVDLLTPLSLHDSSLCPTPQLPQDRYLPIANIARIMKNNLPENAKIAKDSKETVQECVSEFISFITSEASDKCMQEKRKTINGDDLLWAMSTLGFDKYVEPLKLYLSKYREAVRGDKPEKSGGAAGGGATPSEGASSGVGRPPATAASAGDGVGVPPPSKKTKKDH